MLKLLKISRLNGFMIIKIWIEKLMKSLIIIIIEYCSFVYMNDEFFIEEYDKAYWDYWILCI